MLPFVPLALAAYVCGSLPTGVWLGRWAGVDVRASGSGNIGAANVTRTAGMRAGALTLAGDIVKGLVPVLLMRALLADEWAVAAVGLAAFFGHLYSMFLAFSGGKGVATGFGVFLGLAPLAAAACVAVFAIVAVTTRYVSAASISAAISLPLAALASRSSAPISLAAFIVAAMIVLRHRDNLSRLRAGTEPKFGGARQAAEN